LTKQTAGVLISLYDSQVTPDPFSIEPMGANKIIVNGEHGNAVGVFAFEHGIAVDIDNCNVIGKITQQRRQFEDEFLTEPTTGSRIDHPLIVWAGCCPATCHGGEAGVALPVFLGAESLSDFFAFLSRATELAMARTVVAGTSPTAVTR
jgi:hypothetical protein